MNIWTTTVICNGILCLLLLFRGHWDRYRILFASLLFELIAAPILYFTYSQYGTLSHTYSLAYHAKQFLSISFDFGIIFEAWRWRNRKVRIPIELYLLSKLVAFLAERAQFIGISYVIHESLRYFNLIIIVWFVIIFMKPPQY